MEHTAYPSNVSRVWHLEALPRRLSEARSMFMADAKENSQEDAVQKLQVFVCEQMKAGANKPTIAQQLVDMGVNSSDASQVVETIYEHILAVARKEQFASSSIMPAALGSMVAALIGGAIWGVIVIATGYVIGYMASALGFLAGYAVVFCSKGQKGFPLQVIAVIASLVGIAAGKYFTFYYYLRKAVGTKYGVEAASHLVLFSTQVWQVFLENMPSMLNGFDALWVILAVVTAWRIPRSMGIAVPSYRQYL